MSRKKELDELTRLIQLIRKVAKQEIEQAIEEHLTDYLHQEEAATPEEIQNET